MGETGLTHVFVKNNKPLLFAIVFLHANKGESLAVWTEDCLCHSIQLEF
jgi:hypothetical protein